MANESVLVGIPDPIKTWTKILVVTGIQGRSYGLIRKKGTPLKINIKLIKPKNHPIEEENHLPNLHDFGFHINFRGCSDSYTSFEVKQSFSQWWTISFRWLSANDPKKLMLYVSFWSRFRVKYQSDFLHSWKKKHATCHFGSPQTNTSGAQGPLKGVPSTSSQAMTRGCWKTRAISRNDFGFGGMK